MVQNIITANFEMFPLKQLQSSKNSWNKNAFKNTANDSVDFEILFEKCDSMHIIFQQIPEFFLIISAQ